ncbi:T9SS type A sorting domain-containing protein [Winogradskyella sp.]|uniref:T9SS type A sorting domain-containing protein n=1 Tax=Winogradskyella sp. TaxID=1883156 RepID=UPI003F6D850F
MKAPNSVTNYICSVIPCFVLTLFLTLLTNNPLHAQLAFPTATGAGAYVSGGRGYPVYKVTNLQDSGPGTFRQALLNCEANGGGNIVFDVSGTIILNGLLSINNLVNVTIAGQTAPEGGITIGGTGTADGQWSTSPKILINNLDNVIWRYMRFRQEFVSLNHDNLILNSATNFIVDHCSFAAGSDEGLDTTNLNDNFTIQNNLYVMCKTGNIVGSSDNISHASTVSFNRNVFYNTSHRFPNASVSGRHDNINNISWNYVARLCEVQGEIQMNHINNYYASIYGELDNPADGPSYALGRKGMLYRWNNGSEGTVVTPPSIYTAGNILEQTITDPNADNWQFWHWRFDAPAVSGYQGQLAEEGLPSDLQADIMFPLLGEEFEIRTSAEIKQQLPDEVGANARLDENGDVVEDIDAVDLIAINNIKNDIKVYYNQGNFYDEHTQYIRDFWETFSTTPIAVRNDDTNGDGIPEAWANANMPNDAVYSDIANAEGYTYFELYINSVDAAESNEMVNVTGVSVTPNNLDLNIGEFAQVSATVSPSNATNTTGQWSSESPGLASVNDNGVISALTDGNTTVTFTTDNNNFSADVNVTVNNQLFGTYELYNADSDALVNTINNGDSFDLAVVGNQLNIRSIPKNGDSSADVESVKVDWSKEGNSNENGSRIDNTAFYTALADSFGNDFLPYEISTGTYNFTVTYYSDDDALGEIVAINSFSISFFDTALIASAGNDQTICEGEEAILNASGSDSFLWNTGETTASISVSPSTTTTYTVTIDDGFGNTDTDDVTVFVNEIPELVVSEDVTIMAGDSTTLTVQGATTYLWSTGETASFIEVSPSDTTTYTVTGFNNGCENTVQVVVTVIPELNANAGEDVTICFGETVTLNASGGVNYIWNTGEIDSIIEVNPSVTTIYTVTATDAFGNSDSDSVTVTVNEIPVVTVSENIEIIEGDSIELAANGATSYIWSNGETSASILVSPSETTTYSVEGTTNSCSDTAEVTVTVIGQFQASAGTDERVCDNYDYEVTLTANQGDSYLWSTGETTQSVNVSPMSTTTYSVTVTSGIQQDTDDVTVYVDPYPNVVIVNGDSVDILNGDFITLSATGANSYEWNNGATQPNIAVSPSQSTTYSVKGYINDCYDEKEISVNVFQPVVADAGEDKFICLNEVTTLTATGGDEYLWSTGEITPTIEVSPNQTTDYTVTVFNAVDFDEASVRVEVDLDCDQEPIESEQPLDFSFDVYPNPATDYINVKLSGTLIVSDIYLYDFTGKLIYQAEISNDNINLSTTTQIDVRSLNSGIYFVKLVDGGRDVTKKLIVN